LVDDPPKIAGRYTKKNDEQWNELYEWGNLPEKTKLKNFEEAKTKTRVTFYDDGSFSIPIIRDNKPSGIIYIGPKTNSDYYLPGEHLLIVDMRRL